MLKKVMYTALILSNLSMPLCAMSIYSEGGKDVFEIDTSSPSCQLPSSADIINLERLKYLDIVQTNTHSPKIYKNSEGVVFYTKNVQHLFLKYVTGKVLHCLFPEGFPEPKLAYSDKYNRRRDWYFASREIKNFAPSGSEKNRSIITEDYVKWITAMIIFQIGDLHSWNIGTSRGDDGRTYPVCIDYDASFSEGVKYMNNVFKVLDCDHAVSYASPLPLIGLTLDSQDSIKYLVEAQIHKAPSPSFLNHFYQTLSGAVELFDRHGIEKESFEDVLYALISWDPTRAQEAIPFMDIESFTTFMGKKDFIAKVGLSAMADRAQELILTMSKFFLIPFVHSFKDLIDQYAERLEPTLIKRLQDVIPALTDPDLDADFFEGAIERFIDKHPVLKEALSKQRKVLGL